VPPEKVVVMSPRPPLEIASDNRWRVAGPHSSYVSAVAIGDGLRFSSRTSPSATQAESKRTAEPALHRCDLP